jgi:hypothetical protein
MIECRYFLSQVGSTVDKYRSSETWFEKLEYAGTEGDVFVSAISTGLSKPLNDSVTAEFRSPAGSPVSQDGRSQARDADVAEG